MKQATLVLDDIQIWSWDDQGTPKIRVTAGGQPPHGSSGSLDFTEQQWDTLLKLADLLS